MIKRLFLFCLLLEIGCQPKPKEVPLERENQEKEDAQEYHQNDL